MKILLADDDPISRKIISGFLTRFGYQTHVVSDGMEAWGILQTQTAPQIAIFDWMMPRMSGLDAVTKLRGLKKVERTYIILLSSRNSKLDIVKGLEAGADDYLVKPCDLAELQARLRVAERTIKHDQQLRKTIQELENLARRHHLLGSIAGQHVAKEAVPDAAPGPAAVPPPAPATPPAAVPAPAPPEPAAAPVNREPKKEPAPPPPTPAPAVPADLPPLREVLQRSLAEIGLGTGTIESGEGTGIIPEFAVLLPLYFADRQTWVDVAIAFDRRSSHGACRALLRRGANSPQELQDVLVEMVHLLSRAPAMTSLKHSAPAYTLAAVAIDNPGSPTNASRPGGTRYVVRLEGDLRIHVTEYATEVPIVSRRLGELSQGEVVLERITAAGNPDHVIAAPGDVLTGNRLNALQGADPAASVKVVTVPVETRKHLPVNLA